MHCTKKSSHLLEIVAHEICGTPFSLPNMPLLHFLLKKKSIFNLHWLAAAPTADHRWSSDEVASTPVMVFGDRLWALGGGGW